VISHLAAQVRHVFIDPNDIDIFPADRILS
jgi:hypothetical protein